LNRLSRRLQDLQADAKPGSKPILTFDKDDVDTLDFVAASANLRSTIFGIEAKSKFEIKRKRCNRRRHAHPLARYAKLYIDFIEQKWPEISSPQSLPQMR
jgi:hypothetical protein